jgi:hypothetical protein
MLQISEVGTRLRLSLSLARMIMQDFDESKSDHGFPDSAQVVIRVQIDSTNDRFEQSGRRLLAASVRGSF